MSNDGVISLVFRLDPRTRILDQFLTLNTIASSNSPESSVHVSKNEFENFGVNSNKPDEWALKVDSRARIQKVHK